MLHRLRVLVHCLQLILFARFEREIVQHYPKSPRLAWWH